jgi:uncharacterized membrane protein YbhN (UPF0104 family)
VTAVNLRSTSTRLFKFALCVTALWWVGRSVEVDELVAAWTSADPRLLVLALLVFLLTPVLQGVRLRRLLAAQGETIGLAESIRLAFAGNFANFAVPVGSTTGDVLKAAYLRRRMEKPWEAVVLTFVDRAIGFATLLLTVTLIALAAGPESVLAPLRGTLLTLSVGLVGGTIVMRWIRLDGPAPAWLAWLPAREAALRAARVVQATLASPGSLALAIVDTLGIQVAATASFACLALAFGFRLDPHDGSALYAYFSAGEMVKALPGPPQGLGTLEAAYGVFFRDWATTSQIVSAAFAIRMVNLICSLPGVALAYESALDLRPGGTPWARFPWRVHNENTPARDLAHPNRLAAER